MALLVYSINAFALIWIRILSRLLFRDPGVGDGDDDIIFEDFARLRLKAGESDA